MTAPAKYVLVPSLLDEDMAAALECAFSTEGQWESALAARPAALVELREAEMAVIEAAKGSVRWLHPVRCDCDLCNALARRDRALAAVEKNTGAKG